VKALWVLAGILSACCGCPALNENGSGVPIETALAGSTTDVLSLPATSPACVQAGQPDSNVQLQMVQQLNAYRIENGLQPLVYSKTLETAAQNHVEDLYNRNYFAHVDPDGEDPGRRALDAGFCHKYVGENLAAGQTSVTAVMTAWKNSPDHNENMLMTQYVYVGMGHFVDPNGRQYWGQEFAYDVPGSSVSP
jgi:uncharacterized protein YkwD